jgi:hypothetical protein
VRNFRRRLFTIVSVLSLILFLATVGLWVRSVRTYDEWAYYAGGKRVLLTSTAPGRLLLFWGGDMWNPAVTGGRGWTHDSSRQFPRQEAIPMFMSLRGENSPGRGILFPFWIPALLMALGPAWWSLGIPRRRRERRRKLGLCEQCGYDLQVQRAMSLSNERASPVRCPECGRVRN